MTTSSVPPKLLLEFYKDQKVPKLVKKTKESIEQTATANNNGFRSEVNNQESNNFNFASKPFQSHTQPHSYSNPHHYLYGHSSHKSASTNEVLQKFHQRRNQENERRERLSLAKKQKKQDYSPVKLGHNNVSIPVDGPASELKEISDALLKENTELRDVIFELTDKADKLREVNSHLLQRVGELEAKLSVLVEEADREKEGGQKRVKSLIYRQVEEFLRVTVENLAISLTHERMSPIVESKLEGFFEELLNINEVSVQRSRETSNVTACSRFRTNNSLIAEPQEVNQTIKEIIQRQKCGARARFSSKPQAASPIKPRYHTQFDHLDPSSGAKQPRSQALNFHRSNATPPRRIFDQETGSSRGSRSRSRSNMRRRIKIFNQANASTSKEFKRGQSTHYRESPTEIRRHLDFQ